MRLILSGEIRLFQFQKEIHHPELEILEEEPEEEGKQASPGSAAGEESLHFRGSFRSIRKPRVSISGSA